VRQPDHILVEENLVAAKLSNVASLLCLEGSDELGGVGKMGTLTKVQVPLRTMLTYLERSGVVAGSGLQASAGVVVSLETT
jgi:hypothetical protein